MTPTPRQASPHRGRLTRGAIVDQAIALADAEGLKAVTVRRLAQDLGVTPMALYWHFSDKDRLLDALAERIAAKVDPAIDDAAPWSDQLRTLTAAIVRVLRAHPWVAALLNGPVRFSEAYLQPLEVMLAILRRGGFSPLDASHVADHVLRTAVALVADQPRYAPWMPSKTAQVGQRRTREVLEGLPPDRFPHVVEAAVALTSHQDPDAYYAFGLELLLAGIRAAAPHKPLPAVHE